MWDYSTFTVVKNGKPFSTIHFQPGQWTLSLNADGTYIEKEPLKPRSADSNVATGKYEVHKHDLKMRPDKDGRELKYGFKLEADGKVLVLTDKNSGSISNARRE